MAPYLRCTVLFILATMASSVVAGENDYVVVVSNATYQDSNWKPVVAALKAKHAATVITYEGSCSEALPQLAKAHPKYTCFVAKPEEVSREFVAEVHKLSRKYDEDPYTDTLWGILTGYDAGNALSIAKHDTPLVVRKVASGTEIATEMIEEGVWYCELKKNRMVKKASGEAAKQMVGPDDTTSALADALNKYRADLFVTSGHATERNWQIGFSYRNGYFHSGEGKLWGKDTQGKTITIDSQNPKVYLPIGNCLMGHIDSKNAMALAWMKSAGVHQMIGYTVPTWFGYGGWGCLDYFVEQPGRYTFAEAFHANHHALNYGIENKIGSPRGMKFDQDVVALYGDPAWDAKMATQTCAFDQTLTRSGDTYTLTIKGNRGSKSFEPVNLNGSQRGWRPIIAYLPQRIQASTAKVIAGDDLRPLIADDFVLVPNPREYDANRDYEVVFEANEL